VVKSKEKEKNKKKKKTTIHDDGTNKGDNNNNVFAFCSFSSLGIVNFFSKELRYKVLVERKGYAFFVELEYENVPDFCGYCQVVGHNISVCRKANKRNMEPKEHEGMHGEMAGKNDKEKGKAQLEKQNNVWIPKETSVVDLDSESQGKQMPHQDAENNENNGTR